LQLNNNNKPLLWAGCCCFAFLSNPTYLDSTARGVTALSKVLVDLLHHCSWLPIVIVTSQLQEPTEQQKDKLAIS